MNNKKTDNLPTIKQLVKANEKIIFEGKKYTQIGKGLFSCGTCGNANSSTNINYAIHKDNKPPSIQNIKKALAVCFRCGKNTKLLTGGAEIYEEEQRKQRERDAKQCIALHKKREKRRLIKNE